MQDRRKLFEIIRQRSFREKGAFKLASGQMSTIYFNLKPTMLDPEGARLIGTALAERCAALGGDFVGGLELGAVPLVTAVAAMSSIAGRPVRAIFVRKAAKEHGTQSLIEGLAEGEDMGARHVVVVEDVTTTGASALKAVSVLREAGAGVAHVLTVVDREEGAADAFEKEGITLHSLFRKSEFAHDLS